MPNEIRNTLLKIPIPDLMREAGAYMDELHQRISELEAINKALWKDHWEGEDMIDELEAKLERVRELPEYAVQTGGWGGWEIVPAEGFEAQTFVDKDQLDAALKETDNE